jgi:tetratricopeptide (TPR) repeat protein
VAIRTPRTGQLAGAGPLIGLRVCVAGVAVLLMGAGLANAAYAQDKVSTVMEIGGSKLAVSPQEMRALSALGNLARGAQSGRQDRALADARRVVNSRDARFALALYELEIGNRRGDDAMRAGALDVLIASPLTRPERLAGHLAVRGQIAYRAGDFDVAGRLWGRLAELTPTDPDALANLAQVRLAQKDAPGAMDLLTRAIAARTALGQPVAEGWYRQRLSIAQQGQLVAPGADAARALIGAYPTRENWRIALVVYRQLVAAEGALEIDLFRLTRHAGVLTQAAEYQRMAQLLNEAGEPREAKAVLGEGVQRGLLDAAVSPTREIIAEVERAIARVRPGAARAEQPSAAGMQVRLGVARLNAGQRGEAEAAFRAAADDPAGGRYADLGFFWLAWLGRG